MERGAGDPKLNGGRRCRFLLPEAADMVKPQSGMEDNAAEKSTPVATTLKIGPRIWILIAVLILLLMVPFAAMGLALKKSGWLGGSSDRPRQAPQEQPAANSKSRDPDLSTLRKSLEQSAEKILPTPTLPEPSVHVEEPSQ